MNSLTVFAGSARVDDHGVGRARHQPQRLQVLQRIEVHLHDRLEAGDAARHLEERVAVGRGLRDGLRADEPAGARPVDDHERLAQLLRQDRGEHAREGVVAGARAIGHHEGDRTVRPVLRDARSAGTRCRRRSPPAPRACRGAQYACTLIDMVSSRFAETLLISRSERVSVRAGAAQCAITFVSRRETGRMAAWQTRPIWETLAASATG